MTEVFLTTQDLAQRWGMKPQTIRKRRVTGGGPKYVRLGDSPHSKPLYPLSEVERYERERMFCHTAEEVAR